MSRHFSCIFNVSYRYKGACNVFSHHLPLYAQQAWLLRCWGDSQQNRELSPNSKIVLSGWCRRWGTERAPNYSDLDDFDLVKVVGVLCMSPTVKNYGWVMVVSSPSLPLSIFWNSLYTYIFHVTEVNCSI